MLKKQKLSNFKRKNLDVNVADKKKLLKTFKSDTKQRKEQKIESKKVVTPAIKNENVEGDNNTENSDDDIDLELEDISKDDIFTVQFDHELSTELLEALSSKPPQREIRNCTLPHVGKVRFISPIVNRSHSSGCLLGEAENKEATPRPLPSFKQEFSLQTCCIKSQIINKINSSNQRFIGTDLTPLQKELLRISSNYQDLYYPERNFSNSEEIRLVYCCHAINHALKTRMKIIHNNRKSDLSNIRDLGIVRPKVLILLPFRDAALRVVKMIISLLLGDGGNIMFKKRFFEEYSGDTIIMPKKNPKPPDYEQTFSGNTDDNFKIGISLTKKSLRLYTDFYSSDIIIASPLGMRMLIGAEGDANRDYDFLSAIELLIMDQADIFVMQNWEHVLHTVDHMHLVPKESHGTDLTRVRMWALNGWSKYYMQTLVFSSHPLPEVTALFSSRALNYAGQAIVNNPVAHGSIRQVVSQVPQIFHFIEANSVSEAVERRFDVFVSKFLNQFKDPLMKNTLIYVPSYFDFVKIRNYFKRQDISFVQICEYTEDKKIARARDLFFHREVHFMLYSERFHFFRRILIKGIRHILFYQPPMLPGFYSEMCNLLQEIRRGKNESEAREMSVAVLYTKYDVTQLAAIVDTERVTRMLASDQSVHMFMTDS